MKKLIYTHYKIKMNNIIVKYKKLQRIQLITK